jgi:hypothetical protein
MATLYEEIPTLADRTVAADLIITGRFRRLLGTQALQIGDRPRVLGLFEVDVEQVVEGEVPARPLLVRVLGEGDEGRVAWIVSVEDERLLVLMLVRDIEPGLPNNVFAPYFASAFPLSEEGNVQLPEETIDDFTREVTRVEDSTIPLEGLGRLVEEVRRRREQPDHELQRVEPLELRREPYPQITEVPQPDVGGGRAAAPEGKPPDFPEGEPPASAGEAL